MSDLNDERLNADGGAALIRNLLLSFGGTPRPELVETHISWVILAEQFAYKIKKPVDLGFLDFSTLELRRHFCAEELRLNRRFAPSLYLDVVPIGGTRDAPRIGTQPAIDWAVRMRRFAADAGLDHRVASGDASGAALRNFGEALARIHADAAISENPAFGSIDSIRGPALDNFTSLQCELPPEGALHEPLLRLRDWTVSAVAALQSRFAARAAAGRIRECHGDLHLGNIVQIDDVCVAFDCLEFDPALRWIDVISDVGFLTMDLLRMERGDLACEFLNRYLEVSHDYAGLDVLPFYAVYRALVRAKTTALRDAQLSNRAVERHVRQYVQLAERLASPETPALLIVCHGVSGSGKTWLSDRLIAACPAIRIRSDLVRKHLHGLRELDRSDSDVNAGIYDAASSALTYETLAAHAVRGLRAGFDVIVDATCLRRDDRRRLAAAAGAAGAAAVLLHCEADRPVLESRIRSRERAGSDASEAGIAVLARQLRDEEALSAAELNHTVVVDTGRDIDIAAIASALRARAVQ